MNPDVWHDELLFFKMHLLEIIFKYVPMLVSVCRFLPQLSIIPREARSS